MSAAILIPARLGSTRFPRKVLADLCGKPLIEHVYNRACESRLASEVFIAVDSEEVAEAVRGFGGRAVMTDPAHASGTDRIAEAASGLSYDIIVNVQGDEPLLDPGVIDMAIALLEDPRAHMGTAAVPIVSQDVLRDPNAVKVAMTEAGFALYFSRAPIPYHRDLWAGAGGISPAGASVYKHLGIYSYRREVLPALSTLRPTRLEQTEKLEQLRALEHGYRIKVGITETDSIGVDTPEDLERVRKCLSSSS